MFVKKGALLLAAVLLLAGCQPGEGRESTGEASSTEQSVHVSHTSSSQTVIPLPEDSSSEMEESIPLPVTPDPVTLGELLVFTFPEGWTQNGEEALFACSPDGNASVQGSFTAMESMKGLNSELLASAAAPGLKTAWEARGITGVSADVGESTLGGIACFSVSLQGVSGGTAVFQWQAYLPTEDGFWTITVTTAAEDRRGELINCFSGV